MELSLTSVEPIPETIEDAKESITFNCDLVDTEMVHKIAEVLLPGLSMACIDNTTGDPFKSLASVVADMRKEMVDYVTQRSEAFVAESVLLENGPDEEIPDHPYDIISDFVDDFASSKRNLVSRVSGWLLSESREEKIDDFVQEMEINRFWLIDRREAVVRTLLKNVDIKNAFHCNMKFQSAEELVEHGKICSFRSLNCPSEGCNARVSAGHMKKHEEVCPFKMLLCEQKCSGEIMRREMDKHCITVCPMRLVNCPFYSVGCLSTFPHAMVQEHRSENLRSHLLAVLQLLHKEASVDDLKQRCEQLELLSPPGQLAQAQDVRSLTIAVKDLEAKLGPLDVNAITNLGEEQEQTEILNSTAHVTDDKISYSNAHLMQEFNS